MACDMAIVADDARIGDQHANFGLIPGGGSTQRLPRRVGMPRAMELLTTGRWLSGSEAVEWGLALRSAPAESLEADLETLLTGLRPKSRTGLELMKSLAKSSQDVAAARRHSAGGRDVYPPLCNISTPQGRDYSI